MAEKRAGAPNILQDIWDDQRRFNQNFIDFSRLDDKKRVEESKEYILHLISECDEFLRELAWKNHRKEDPTIIRSNLKEEYIDMFKYWLSLGVLWQITPEEILEEYWRKSAVVEQRYKQEIQLSFDGEKIAGIDIDGVLADYPGSFLTFVNQELGTNYKLEGVRQYDIGKALGLPRDLYEELKDKYRQSGYKKTIPVLPDAKEFLFQLQKEGYKIVLLTARPYKRYKRLFADTQEWLTDNGLVYDAILWDEDKCHRLIREFGLDNVSFFVEDHLGNANEIAREGVLVYLLDKPYNQGETQKGVYRIKELGQITAREGWRCF